MFPHEPTEVYLLYPNLCRSPCHRCCLLALTMPPTLPQMLPKEPLYMPQMLPSVSNHATHPATDAAEGAAVHAAPEHQGARPPQLRLSSGGRYACGQVSARVQHRAPDGRQVSQLSCPKITIFLWNSSPGVENSSPKQIVRVDFFKAKWDNEFGGKSWWFQCYGFVGDVWQSLISKRLVKSKKFTLKIRSESGKLCTTGCHFPPKLTNFGTLQCQVQEGRGGGGYRCTGGKWETGRVTGIVEFSKFWLNYWVTV